MSGGEAVGILGLLGLLSTCRDVFDLVCEVRDAGDLAQKWFGKIEFQRFLFGEWLHRISPNASQILIPYSAYQLTICIPELGIGLSPSDGLQLDSDRTASESEALSKLAGGDKGRIAWRQIGIILRSLSTINDLQARYDLSGPTHELLIKSSVDDAQGAFQTQEDFINALVKSKEKVLARVKETQKSLSPWKKSRWVFRDEQKMSRCCQDLEEANETLRSLMAQTEKEALMRGIVTEVKSMLTSVSLRVDHGSSSAVFRLHNTSPRLADNDSNRNAKDDILQESAILPNTQSYHTASEIRDMKGTLQSAETSEEQRGLCEPTPGQQDDCIECTCDQPCSLHDDRPKSPLRKDKFTSPNPTPGLVLAVNEHPSIANAVAPLIQVERMVNNISQPDHFWAERASLTDEFRSYYEVHGLRLPEQCADRVLDKGFGLSSRKRGMLEITKPGHEDTLTVFFEVRLIGDYWGKGFEAANLELASLLHAASQPAAATGLTRCPFVGFISYYLKGLTQECYATAFCFEAPKSLRGIANGPEPLFHSLTDRLLDPGACPPLGIRFVAAQRLAREYYNFVETGWLHKGIRSQNVIFWRAVDEPELEWQPVLLGFGYARPESLRRRSGKESLDSRIAAYIHPEYRKNQETTPYELAFDLYSLAVILIDLAFWKPASLAFAIEFGDPELEWLWDLTGSSFPCPNVLATGRIEGEELSSLQVQMGTRYADAVQTLLNGALGGSKNKSMSLAEYSKISLARISRQFSGRVLKPLEECCA